MPTQNLDSSAPMPPTTLRSEANAIVNRLRALLERLVHTGEAIHGPAQQAGGLQDKPVVAPPGTPPVANSVSEAHTLLDKIESVVGETVRKL